MNPLWTVILIIAPLPVFLVVARIRLLLQRRRAAATETTPKKQFEPTVEPAPNALLRSFSLLERVYLREQMPTARVGFYIVAWLVFAVMIPSLLPGNVSRYRVIQSNPMAVWNSFLHATLLLSVFGSLIAVFTAIVAGVGLTGKIAQTMFYRTRPLTHRLLFWGRVALAFCSMLLGYLAGLAAAFAVLVACYGPVWNRVDMSSLPMHLKAGQVHDLVWLLRSPLPIFLSIATSMVFIFSIVMVLLLQPFQTRALPKPVIFVAGFFVFEAFSVLGSTRAFPALTHLGLTASGSNAAPSLPMYLLPLILSAVLLGVAQLAASRKEN